MMYHEFGSLAVPDLKHFECDSVHWNCHCLRYWGSIGDSWAGSSTGGL